MLFLLLFGFKLAKQTLLLFTKAKQVNSSYYHISLACTYPTAPVWKKDLQAVVHDTVVQAE